MAISIEEVWSEIDPRFIPDAQGRLRRVVNVASVEAGIDNILRTRKGERVMLPEFGTILPDIVFEPMNSTAVKFLTRTLKDEIERWDDRVLIEAVEVFPDPDRATLSIRLLYRVRGFPSNTFKFESEIKGDVYDS